MLVRSARLVVPYLVRTATGMNLLARSSCRRRQPVPERSLGYSARALVRFSPQSAWPDATKASNLVVVRIGADDDFAAGVDCVRSVKRIAGCKSRIRHEFDGLPRYRPVGNRKLEIQLVNRLPQSISSREAIPAAPAVAAQRSFRLAGLRRQSWPGSTPSASASRPIVSRSTRVA